MTLILHKAVTLPLGARFYRSEFNRSHFCLYFRMHSSFIRRGDALRNFIKDISSKGDVVIICGAVDEDLYVAANTKSFLITAGWVTPEEKVEEYGILAPTPNKMRALIEIIIIQTSWYYLCAFDDPVPTKVVSLCLSNTFTAVSSEEVAMAEAFEAILKKGAKKPAIRQALICYLMAGQDIICLILSVERYFELGTSIKVIPMNQNLYWDF